MELVSEVVEVLGVPAPGNVPGRSLAAWGYRGSGPSNTVIVIKLDCISETSMPVPHKVQRW